ncbi:MAG: bifunctional methylenetetrahydrofolate dehydrogenase/methenyltetrahydrofolate cyclohydrolase FolD [Bacteroidetes bacterium]|nr:bifunctional methylenetetrahydrofolate dehydrogenase/methenyltetrahydrofolate cyclohydrolase FolD [Bacteroidota bacterium]
MPIIIDGTIVSNAILDRVKAEAEELRRERGITPGLAVVLVGDDPASATYVRSKGRMCERLGFHSITHRLPASTSALELLSLIAALNADSAIHGILVQSPLPGHIDYEQVVETIDYHKDVDGFHPVNVGRMVIGLPAHESCTPAGVLAMLTHYQIPTSGRSVVIIGRSNIVGKPLANMMMQKREGGNAIVTVAHSAAADLGAVTRNADIVIAAIGRPRYITADMVKEGAVVIDVGINRVDDPGSEKGYRIVGDVDFDAVAPKCSAITPVPGGVGKMTIAMLMLNTLRSARGDFH